LVRTSAGGGDFPLYKPRLNPAAMPNPVFLGLAALGFISIAIGALYLSVGAFVGWTLAVIGLFVFAAAAGAVVALRSAGVLAAAAVLLLVLSYLGVLPA
jgi:hypothetical protein